MSEYPDAGKVIVVKVRTSDLASSDPEEWAMKLYHALRAGGIPATKDGGLERGTIRRYDDPHSWDWVFYEWWEEGYTPSVMD
jgi:hypothetical protein